MVISRRGFVLAAGAVPALASEPRPEVLSVVNRRLGHLARVQSIYIDVLDGAAGSGQIRDLLFAEIQKLDLFVLTENDTKADAFLRGTAEDVEFMDLYDSREGINVRIGNSRSRRETGESKFDSATASVGDTTDIRRQEKKHEALAAVRLVLPDGEVIWSTAEESAGAKYRSAAAEVAARVADSLRRSYETARRTAQALP